MIRRTMQLVGLAVALPLLLAACAGGDVQDLEEYTNQVIASQKPRVEPLPEFVPYDTFTYQAQNLRGPFSAPTQAQAQGQQGAGGSGIKPDFERPREPLEAFPLDALRMVGTLDKDDQSWGLVKSIDGTIHRIQPGNYLGENHGKILHISEQEITLTEVVPDGMGGWIERDAALTLSE